MTVTRHGSVEVLSLSPGETVPADGAGTESAVVVLAGAVSGLGAGTAHFRPAGGDAGPVAGPAGARVLLVRARTVRRPPSSPDASSAVLEAGGGFTDMRVRWLVSASTAGSTALVVATSTFAHDGHHELHRHHGADEFFMVVEGSGEHLTADGAIRLGPGDLVVVPAGDWHGYRTDPGITTTTVYGYLGAASLDDAGYEVRS
jgi:quercetin dioxygenase-like cupin family protein